jgi:hypothetical protein
MNPLLQDLARVVSIGIGATVVMDAWLLLLKRLGVPTLNFAFIGRWVGHLARGTASHPAIARAAPVRGERALGWLTHYAVGIAFAALMVSVGGTRWTREPSLWPALCVGIATVVVPLFVMQPAMGAGIASSKTATPAHNVVRSIANHAVFGLGLFLAANLVAWSLQ